jgi:hypothetical protein
MNVLSTENVMNMENVIVRLAGKKMIAAKDSVLINVMAMEYVLQKDFVFAEAHGEE